MPFTFKPEGTCEFYQVSVNNFNGGQEKTFIYKKGMVQFHPNHSFTFYPTEGNKRQFYQFCDTVYHTNIPELSAKDLSPLTYYYTLRSISKDKEQ
ncbi:hypothetical protein [Adhaeribacter radiodurans]|uniref:Uncharacterized protein n=1 Tax=Adhaeribacter radiodurans TaxID=2745197 RepID=A0A7L7L9Y8_9BACT|nr:hypothetical protein [Adhaeribacter radiodurans]QMU29651.1 hypothetical protein HUW48_17155 [Adhaeribacter radiodurans]